MSDIMKARLACAGVFVVSGGGAVWNWYHLLTTGRYYPMLALFAPISALVFLLFLFFPHLAPQPREKKAEIIVNSVVGIGLLLGAMNWYLMANGF